MFVKHFSIKKEKDYINLTLFCLTPHGKEKIVKVNFSLPVLENFIWRVRKFCDKLRGVKEEISYVG